MIIARRRIGMGWRLVTAMRTITEVPIVGYAVTIRRINIHGKVDGSINHSRQGADKGVRFPVYLDGKAIKLYLVALARGKNGAAIMHCARIIVVTRIAGG